MKLKLAVLIGLLGLSACGSDDSDGSPTWDPLPQGSGGAGGDDGSGGDGGDDGTAGKGSSGDGGSGGDDAAGGAGGGPTTPDYGCGEAPDTCYVRVKDGKFVLDGKTYRYMGTNFWSAPYLSIERLREELEILQAQGVKNLRIMALSEGDIPDAQKNDQQVGPQRITPASSDAPCLDADNKAYVERLRATLDEVHKHGMKAVLTLNNWYHWSGGMPQYIKWAHEHPDLECEKTYDDYVVSAKDPETGESLFPASRHVPFANSTRFQPADDDACEAVPISGDFAIPHPNTITVDTGKAWDDQQDLSTLFLCNTKAQQFFFSRAEHMIQALKDHPGIMAWQLANEPRSFRGWSKVFKLWVTKTAKFIKDIDPNHLVSIGSEGELYQWGDYANSDYADFHKGTNIDYLTFHVWPENWSWYDPSLPIDSDEEKGLLDAIEKSDEFVLVHLEHAKALGMPAVPEEFGLARDDKSKPVDSTVEKRNRYYRSMFDHVANNPEFPGVNFWAWGGKGRPSEEVEFWRLNDDYIGDPPHEVQGWYSVYDTDSDTLALMLEYADKIEGSK